jgi:hypothetical protein
MTQNAMERLERANPVPDDPGAPPIETALARIEAAPRRPRLTPPAWRSAVLPTLGTAAALAVVAVALVFAGHGARRSTPASTRAGGLPGVVSASAAYFEPGHEIVSIAQCSPCQTNGAGQVEHYWTLVSNDGGGSWREARTPPGTDVGAAAEYNPVAAQFDQHGDVWAVGSRRTRSGGFAFDALVSRDSGLRWSRARVPIPGLGGDISVAGNAVWVTAGGYCESRGCARAEVLHGSSSGFLRRAASAPWSGSSALQVAAEDANTAYLTVTANQQARRTLVTHDGGGHWTQLPSPCMTTVPDGVLRSAGHGAVWELCPLPGRTGTEIDSSTGGRFWFRGYFPRNWGGIKDIEPVSARSVWAVTDNGVVGVSNDHGFTWHKVWSAGSYSPRPHQAIVSPQSGRAASVFATQTFGRLTRVVEYRTHDAGATWTVSYVPVPSQK